MEPYFIFTCPQISQAMQGALARVARPFDQEDGVEPRGGGEAAALGQAHAHAVADHRAHRRANGSTVPRALRAPPRPSHAKGQDRRVLRRRRPASAASGRDRPESGEQARAARPDRHGRGREGDALRGACALGQHAGQEGKAQGAREAAGGVSPPRRAAEAARAQGRRHRAAAAIQKGARCGLQYRDPFPEGGPRRLFRHDGRGRCGGGGGGPRGRSVSRQAQVEA
mmetsp:Transcript_1680/g.3513  ORF Transcript_1680/g.3513 Transcript_1680/m.3513 type:complete len:226 (-) Transcript_1680:1076-1753(-)